MSTIIPGRSRSTALAIAALAVCLGSIFGSRPAVAQSNEPIPPAPVRFDGHRVVRASLESMRDLRTILALSPDVWSESIGVGELDVRIPPDAMEALDATGIEYEVLIQDVQALIDRERRAGGGGGDGEWFDIYHQYSEINQYLLDLENLNPAIAQRIEVGTSLEGRTIYGIRITGPGSDKPAILYNGCQHAREWITTMATTFIADQLVRSYGADPELTSLVDDVEFFIVPIVNPDGFVYTWTNDRLWRKNRRNNGGGSFGVDLNRNWGGTGWGGQGSSGDPFSDVYRGTGPFSEPETQVIRDFILNNPQIGATIDIHSYGQLVLAPWGYTSELPADHELFQDLGASMRDAIVAQHGTFWVHGPTYTTIYPAAGIVQDWAYEIAETISYGYELRDRGNFGFILPAEQIIPASEEAFAGAMVLADFLRTKIRFNHPSAPPTLTEPGQPTLVEVEIEAINGAQYQSGSATLFARIGSSGNFTPYPMQPAGGNLFEADLPAADCGETIEFYFQAETTDGYVATDPDGAPLNVYHADAINSEVVFSDNFESDQGWAVQNFNLTDGAWQRGVPAGDGSRGDPTADYDGSGRCYLTANRPDNSDVDGGPTRLTSATLDLSSADDALVSYARWFTNDDNDQDRLTVEVSDDNGSNWTLVESVGGSAGWTAASFRVADFVAPTATVRIRFSATDNPNDSVTEGAIDAVQVALLTCDGSGGEFSLEVSPLFAGQQGSAAITNGRPDEMAWLAYSVIGPGSTFVPQLNVTLDLARPTQAGPGVRTNASGAATFPLPIPGGAAGRDVWFQAVQFEAKTNLVSTTIQ